MKVLYVVNACDEKYIDFYAAQVIEENEKEFITIDKIKIENYIKSFPKSKINTEFTLGYVTDTLDKDILRIQIDRIYNKLKENNITKDNEINERYYNSSIDLLNRIVTPKEYESGGYAKKEHEELMKKLAVFF